VQSQNQQIFRWISYNFTCIGQTFWSSIYRICNKTIIYKSRATLYRYIYMWY